MKKEEKELLLKSLCETAQYGVKGLALGKKIDTIKTICLSEYPFIVTNGGLTCHVGEQFKPYLRPMSSMTQEEKDNFQQCLNIIENENYGDGWSPVAWEQMAEFIHYCNKHHFDYRGLIEKGLALEAPEGMYN